MWILDELQRQDHQKLSLREFVQQAWHIVEPQQPYIHGWHIDAICDHLEAVTAGDITRLLINVPPGMMKSLLVSVFWPAWEWGPRGLASYRYLGVSHMQTLSIRDALRMKRLVQSDWYQSRYPHVRVTRDQNAKTKFETTATGLREALAAGSMTGSRGDRVLIDDPFSVEDARSETILASRREWFLEAVPTRLNVPKISAIIVIMQRLHELDTAGIILSMPELGYDILCLPMEFEPERVYVTSIGFKDPRTEEGELLFPERFDAAVVDKLKASLGEYGAAGQLQQRPAPRDGGIIKNAWIRRFKPEYDSNYNVIEPAFHYVIQSWDTAFKDGEQNDYSCCTTWGINNTGAYLINIWKKKVPFPELLKNLKGLAQEYKPSKILIEDKASGQSLIQAAQTSTNLPICPVKIDRDKITRLHAVSGFFEAGRVFIIEGAIWEKDYVHSICSFPSAPHDDDVDSTTQALAEIFLGGQTTRIDNFSIMGR